MAENKITGHCNICNSDICFEWDTEEELIFIYDLMRKIENFTKKTGKCACSIMKNIIKEAEK